MKTLTIFADVQNIYYTTKEAFNAHFDYNAFWAQAAKDRKVIKAIAYAVDRGDEKQRQFQNILRGIGFEVKTKPFVQRSDGTAKGDWDVGITMDMMEHSKDSDVAILLSGDGDFSILVDKICKDYGTEVEVYGVEKLTALALKRAASTFVPIEGDLLM